MIKGVEARVMTEYEIQKARKELDEMNKVREKNDEELKKAIRDLREAAKNYKKAAAKSYIATVLMGLSVLIQIILLLNQ